MRVAVAQLDTVPDVAANLGVITALTLSAAADGAQIVVFPEASMYQCMSSATELRDCAQPVDGTFVGQLTVLAATANVTVVVGMYETSGLERPYNTLVVVGPDGLRASHRKSLVYDAFGYCESDYVMTAAPQSDLFEVGGLKFGLVTCYEIRFPECSRSLIDAGADVLVMCSAWPIAQGKEDHFTTMIKARALENTVYVAVASECSSSMVGRSQVIDPLGYQVAGLSTETGYVCADIDAERIARARELLPVLKHRRQYLSPIAI